MPRLKPARVCPADYQTWRIVGLQFLPEGNISEIGRR